MVKREEVELVEVEDACCWFVLDDVELDEDGDEEKVEVDEVVEVASPGVYSGLNTMDMVIVNRKW